MTGMDETSFNEIVRYCFLGCFSLCHFLCLNIIINFVVVVPMKVTTVF